MSHYEVDFLKLEEGKWVFRFVREVLAVSHRTYENADEAYKAALEFIEDIKNERVNIQK